MDKEIYSNVIRKFLKDNDKSALDIIELMIISHMTLQTILTKYILSSEQMTYDLENIYGRQFDHRLNCLAFTSAMCMKIVTTMEEIEKQEKKNG